MTFTVEDSAHCEQRLWLAVIMQAIEDATAAPSKNLEREAERERARRWLTEPNAQFDTVCSFAGLEPEAVRTDVAAVIAQRDIEIRDRPNRRRGRLICLDGKYATLREWAEQAGIGVSTLLSRMDRQRLSLREALAQGPAKGPGVVRDFSEARWDRRGRDARDFSELEVLEGAGDA